MIMRFESVDEILECDHSNESYQAVLSCGAVYYAYKMVLTFQCDHSNESYQAVLSCSTVYYAVQSGSLF